MHSSGGACGSQSEESAVNATEVGTTKHENMTVKQLVQEINSQNLQVKGLSKLKKSQLIDILMNSE